MKKNNRCCILVVGLLIVLVLIGGFIAIKVSKIPISKIPEEVCYTETSTGIVEIGHYEYISADMNVNIHYEGEIEYLCEEGVKVNHYKHIKSIWFEGTDKICIVKYIEELCEIK